MAIELTKKKTSVFKSIYKVTVTTMVGDGDRYPEYSKYFHTLTDDLQLLVKYIKDEEYNLSAKEYDDGELLYEQVMEEDRDPLHDLFFHWDGRADDWETIQSVKIEYFDENGDVYDVKLK